MADVVFILEGPKGTVTSQQAVNRVVAQMGGPWQAASIHTPALGNESEYVIYVWDGATINGIVAQQMFVAQCAGHRAPVHFAITGVLHAAGGNGVVNTLVWHAPPIGQNPGQLWTNLRAQINNNINFDLLMGDFNSNPTAPTGYTDVPQQNNDGGTMILNPLRGIADTTEGVGGQANDRIFVRNGFQYHAGYFCGVLNPLDQIVGEDILSPIPGTNRAKRRRPAIDESEAHKIAWETSDHAPMIVTV